jgi:hypothetical protein
MPWAVQNRCSSPIPPCMARPRRTASPAPYKRTMVGNLAQLASTMPPLRPLAPKPQKRRSITHTSSPGSRWSSRMAVHSPVKPPPTMTTSAVRGSGPVAPSPSQPPPLASSSHHET